MVLGGWRETASVLGECTQIWNTSESTTAVNMLQGVQAVRKSLAGCPQRGDLGSSVEKTAFGFQPFLLPSA